MSILAKIHWPLTLNFDLSPSLCYGSIWPFMPILSTEFHNHWPFSGKVKARKCHFWPKFIDLWPWTLTYHRHYVMGVFDYSWQSFPPKFITSEHSKPKLWPENVIFCQISVTFDLGQICPKTNQRIYTSCSVLGPSLTKIHSAVFLKTR